MPIRAEVEGVGTLEFPDGTDQAVIDRTVRNAVASRGSGGVGQHGMAPGFSRRDLMGAPGAFLRGMRDPVDAGAQLAVRGANVLWLAPDSEVARVEGINKTAEEDYRNKWRGGEVPPIDIPRILGAGAVGGVATAPAKIAPTLMGRAGQAAVSGAFGGLATPIPDAKDNADFFLKKGWQAAIGAGSAALGQPAIEGIGSIASQVVASAANRGAGLVRGAMGELSDANIRAFATLSLRDNGVNFEELSKEVQKSLVNDVREALKKYGGVSAGALARQADYDSLGVSPLKAWVTRDPIEFGKVKNLEATDAGDVLKQARASLDKTLLDRIEGLRGGNTGDAYQSGVRAGDALSKAHASAKDQVAGLYDAFRRTAPNVAADPKRLGDTILDAVEKDALGDYLGPLRNLINDFTTGKRPTTPDSLYRAQQVANAVVRKGGPEGMAARKVVEGIDNELEQMGRDMSAVGPEMAAAANILKKARAAHRDLKMTEEAVPAFKAVADGSYAAEDFLSRYVVGADVKEVAAMWSKLGSDDVKQAARSQLIDALKKAAAADETAPFKAGQFRKFIEAPGMRQKLEIILGKGGRELVEKVDRAATNAISIPSGTRYNTSGTAMELVNLSSRLPVIGPMVGDPLKGAANQFAASQAQRAGPSAFGQGLLDPFSEEWLRRSRRLSGLLAPAVGGGAAFGVSQ